MPQFQPITIGDDVFTPDDISTTSAVAQNLEQPLGVRDRLIFDRNMGEGNGKSYRRVLRIQLQRDAGTTEAPVPYQITGTFTLNFPPVADKAAREEVMDKLSAALGNADIRKAFGNPEWFF